MQTVDTFLWDQIQYHVKPERTEQGAVNRGLSLPVNDRGMPVRKKTSRQKQKRNYSPKRICFRIILSLFFLCLFLGGCGGSEKREQKEPAGTSEEGQNGEFKIVTSFYPLYIMMMNLTDGVPGVSLSNMAKPTTGCLHDYQLRPQDLVCLEDADLFVANGGGMEDFLKDVFETYPELPMILAMDGLEDGELLPGGEEDEGGNPHTWMSLSLYIKELENLTNELKEADEIHAQSYQSNFDAYRRKVEALEEEYGNLKTKNHGMGVVLLHESFGYLTEEFGYRVTGSLEVEKDSGFSAKEMREIIDEMKRTGADAIFSDSQYSGRISRLLSEETGMKAYQLDSCVSGKYEKDAYINSMRQNLEVLKHAESEAD